MKTAKKYLGILTLSIFLMFCRFCMKVNGLEQFDIYILSTVGQG